MLSRYFQLLARRVPNLDRKFLKIRTWQSFSIS